MGRQGRRFQTYFPLALSLSPSSSRKNKKKKKRERKEYIHRFPGLTAKKEPERLEFAAKSSNETTSYSHAILSILGFAINLDSWFVEVLVEE